MATSTIAARGVTFAYESRGSTDDPLALVLHGFPDSPVGFLELLDALADDGYHAVAPWLRGFAPTSVPQDGDYHVGSLGADANALHDALGGDARAVLLGHDWGASATYAATSVAPQRWRRGVAMSVPPLASMLAAMQHPAQLQRSWYMWLFNTPVGESALAANDLELVDLLWEQWSPGLARNDAAVAIAGAKSALAGPERVAAAVGYYRSLFAAPPADPDALAAQLAALQPSTVPILYLHGVDDGCIGIDEIGDTLVHLAEGSAMERVEGAGHFLHLERPSVVTDLVRSFLST